MSQLFFATSLPVLGLIKNNQTCGKWAVGFMEVHSSLSVSVHTLIFKGRWARTKGNKKIIISIYIHLSIDHRITVRLPSVPWGENAMVHVTTLPSSGRYLKLHTKSARIECKILVFRIVLFKCLSKYQNYSFINFDRWTSYVHISKKKKKKLGGYFTPFC